MRFFRKKKLDPITLVDNHMKERPDEILVTEKFMAVYQPLLETTIIIPGDFSNVTEAEANKALQDYLLKMKSK